MRPQVLLGDSRSALGKHLWEELGWGRMVVDRTPRPHLGEPWALDNGAYRYHKQSIIPDFSLFERRLQKAVCRMRQGTLHLPLFVVVPDLIGAGSKALSFSRRWVERLRSLYPELSFALVLQNGFQPQAVKRCATEFDWFFLAGDDGFKHTEGFAWRVLAGEMDKRFHYARCSTPFHLLQAIRLVADSVDSARPLTRQEYLQQFRVVWEGA